MASKGWSMAGETRLETLRGLQAQYHPCDTGLHICGVDDDNEALRYGPHFTVLNLPLNEGDARALFARAEAELAHDDMATADLIVDLCIDGSTEENFPMMRQMLDRLVAMKIRREP